MNAVPVFEPVTNHDNKRRISFAGGFFPLHCCPGNSGRVQGPRFRRPLYDCRDSWTRYIAGVPRRDPNHFCCVGKGNAKGIVAPPLSTSPLVGHGDLTYGQDRRLSELRSKSTGWVNALDKESSCSARQTASQLYAKDHARF